MLTATLRVHPCVSHYFFNHDAAQYNRYLIFVNTYCIIKYRFLCDAHLNHCERATYNEFPGKYLRDTKCIALFHKIFYIGTQR
jgi:hypothetical protein